MKSHVLNIFKPQTVAFIHMYTGSKCEKHTKDVTFSPFFYQISVK